VSDRRRLGALEDQARRLVLARIHAAAACLGDEQLEEIRSAAAAEQAAAGRRLEDLTDADLEQLCAASTLAELVDVAESFEGMAGEGP
jgi:hypothetical protein